MSEKHHSESSVYEQLFKEEEQPQLMKWSIAGSIYITLLFMWLPMPNGQNNLNQTSHKVIREPVEHSVLNVAKPNKVIQAEVTERRERRPMPTELMEPELVDIQIDTNQVDHAVSTDTLAATPDWDFSAAPAPPGNHQMQPLSSDYPGLVKPRFIKKVPPAYPKIAARYKLQGTVVLRVILRRDGSIDEIEVLRELSGGKFGFEEEAIKAVKQWRFLPGSLNDKPVDIEAHLEISFKLN